MALVCNTQTAKLKPFQFIDCSTISVSYDITGLASVSFVVVSTSRDIDLNSYSSVTFGSNREIRKAGSKFSAGTVLFKGYVNSYEISLIPGTLVYEHKISLVAWGCRI